jgi:hypothetical protein
MLHHRHTALPVVDGEVRLIGILSEADILTHPPAGRSTDVTVSAVMTRTPIAVDVAATAGQVRALIADRGLRTVPVVDRDRLVGVLSRSDVVWAVPRTSPPTPGESPGRPRGPALTPNSGQLIRWRIPLCVHLESSLTATVSGISPACPARGRSADEDHVDGEDARRMRLLRQDGKQLTPGWVDPGHEPECPRYSHEVQQHQPPEQSAPAFVICLTSQDAAPSPLEALAVGGEDRGHPIFSRKPASTGSVTPVT